MNREQAEKIISEALELIRLVCKAYDPDYGHCSMYVTPHSKAAYILKDGDEDDGEYILNLHEVEVEEDDADC